MYKTLSWVIFSLLILPACSTLNFYEIVHTDHIAFDSLQLMPDADPYGLRIALIRKSQIIQLDDSTETTENMPFSPLGFCLGNGLFYDLHGNLSLLPEQMLGVSAGNEFAIAKTNKSGRSILYQLANDTLSLTKLPKGKIRILLSKTSAGDTVTYNPKRGRTFSIILTDTSTLMAGKRRIITGIYRKEKNSFGLKSRKDKVRFYQSGNSVVLYHDLMISQSVDRKTIQILRYRKRQNGTKPIFTMVRSDDKIFIYNKNMRGLKIEISENMVSVSDGKNIIESWKKHPNPEIKEKDSR